MKKGRYKADVTTGVLLSHACQGCVRVSVRVRACVCLSHFYINLYISFFYEDIFTKFTENVHGYENMSVKNVVLILKKNQYGCHSRLFENH